MKRLFAYYAISILTIVAISAAAIALMSLDFEYKRLIVYSAVVLAYLLGGLFLLVAKDE